MVIKVAEYTGTLNCKNCVIVPYTSRSQAQSKPQSRNTNNCASQTISTSLFYQHQQHDNEQDTKNEILWHKQFARWWSWNWQRKRASILSKFAHNRKKLVLTKNKSVECNLTPSEKIIYTPLVTSSIRNYRNEKFEPVISDFIPVLNNKCSTELKPQKSRKHRNKHKERVYEGWMREISDTETDSETNIVVKGETHKNNRMHYLSIRVKKLNSDLSQKHFKEKVNEYKSPITGKTYNLSLTKVNGCYENSNETKCLNPKPCSDQDFLPNPEIECTKQYYKIKNEHFDLITSICEIMKNNNLKTDEESLESNRYCDEDIPDVSQSLPVFVERTPLDLSLNGRYTDEIILPRSNYDINYLYNNLEVFKSSITETNFIWEYLENKPSAFI